MHDDYAPSQFSYVGREETERALFYSSLVGDQLAEEGAARHGPGGSEVPRELALFTAVEGGMVEEGAGCTAPLRPFVFLLVCNGLHHLTSRV